MARLSSLETLARQMEPGFTVLRPEGPGPFGVLIQMHGCGGMQPLQMTYARAVCDAGFAVVVVDSFAPRGLSRLAATLTVCTGLAMHGARRAADLFAVLHWLERRPWADRDRVAAAGWSHGGWTLLDALALETPALLPGRANALRLSDAPERLQDRLKAVILVYPYAGPACLATRHGWPKAAPPVFAVLAGRDQVVGTAAPAAMMRRLQAEGADLEQLVLPQATHAFDDQAASDPRTRYRADYTDQTLTFLLGALGRHLS